MDVGVAESPGSPAHYLQSTMTATQLALVALAGLLAGSINAIVGAGSLITFPTLLADRFGPLLNGTTTP